jgi:hypothetical protein
VAVGVAVGDGVGVGVAVGDGVGVGVAVGVAVGDGVVGAVMVTHPVVVIANAIVAMIRFIPLFLASGMAGCKPTTRRGLRVRRVRPG